MTTVNLANQSLTRLPLSAVKQIVGARALNVHGNMLSDISFELPPTSLEEADLGGNLLVICPSWVITVAPLRVLKLDHNKLSSLPPAIGDLVHLQELDVSSNLISSIPDTITALRKLSSVNVSNNQLQFLPAQIGNCSALTLLNVCENELTALPSSIGQLQNLKSFDCRHNKLTAIPSTIGHAYRLHTLHLSNNELTALPPSIGQLALRKLTVSGNPLIVPPRDVCLQGTAVIVQYLRDLPEDPFQAHATTVSALESKIQDVLSEKRNALEEAAAVRSGSTLIEKLAASNYELIQTRKQLDRAMADILTLQAELVRSQGSTAALNMRLQTTQEELIKHSLARREEEDASQAPPVPAEPIIDPVAVSALQAAHEQISQLTAQLATTTQTTEVLTEQHRSLMVSHDTVVAELNMKTQLLQSNAVALAEAHQQQQHADAQNAAMITDLQTQLTVLQAQQQQQQSVVRIDAEAQTDPVVKTKKKQTTSKPAAAVTAPAKSTVTSTSASPATAVGGAARKPSLKTASFRPPSVFF
eukprot:TRINITY_DN640_c0_g1_i1.p1 TRINITY_DN640_c0_g1~~TRINITY_DN640_c0_g1_i1.p1  ORF type:complete len:530 (-),score=134.15 TRINITY_DN640_c0_g1_i1:1549-3138(-)